MASSTKTNEFEPFESADMYKDASYATTAKWKEIKHVGKKVKGTKRRVTWIFGYCNRTHTLELFDSLTSGKKRLVIDGKTVFQSVLSDLEFSHVVAINDINVKVTKKHSVVGPDQYVLLVNGVRFSQLRRSSPDIKGSPPPPGAGHKLENVKVRGDAKDATSKASEESEEEEEEKDNEEDDEPDPFGWGESFSTSTPNAGSLMGFSSNHPIATSTNPPTSPSQTTSPIPDANDAFKSLQQLSNAMGTQQVQNPFNQDHQPGSMAQQSMQPSQSGGYQMFPGSHTGNASTGQQVQQHHMFGMTGSQSQQRGVHLSTPTGQSPVQIPGNNMFQNIPLASHSNNIDAFPNQISCSPTQGGMLFQQQSTMSMFNNQSGMSSPTFNNQQGMSSPTFNNQHGMSSPTFHNQQGMSSPTFNNQQGMNSPTFNNQQGMNSPTFNNQQGMNSPTFNNQPGMGSPTFHNQAMYHQMSIKSPVNTKPDTGLTPMIQQQQSTLASQMSPKAGNIPMVKQMESKSNNGFQGNAAKTSQFNNMPTQAAPYSVAGMAGVKNRNAIPQTTADNFNPFDM